MPTQREIGSTKVSIKNPILGGYIYQNLIGLELLYDWLENPKRFEWIQFEADKNDAPKGLDDIIAKLANDGSMLLWQVKFTVDPTNENNSLSWDWLLNRDLKKPKSRSLLKKWSDSFHSLDEGKVSECALVTNRRPNREFKRCLNSNYVDLSKIPVEISEEINSQLGFIEANKFLNEFEFRHSQLGYDSLDITLRDRYITKYTDFLGWYKLKNEAIVYWATTKKSPPPEGQITIDILKGILDIRRSQPILQNFNVPKGYIPPDDTFDKNFIDKIQQKEGNIFILWGTPGQGKSTYLSYLCNKFDEAEIPFIRHHYFLDLRDRSERFSLLSVSNSLMHQMENYHFEFVNRLKGGFDELHKWISACGAEYKHRNMPFVVIIDGLDHVWRENDHNREPLEGLFNQLLPLPEGVILIIGTQKIDNAQLPSRLVEYAKPSDWVELPLMSMSSIKSWLENKLESRKFECLLDSAGRSDSAINSLAETFHSHSSGHPLHLIYSFEMATNRSRLIVPHNIHDLPDCPDGNIKNYYQKLWGDLSYNAKDALHIVAAAGFIWPVGSLEECLEVDISKLHPEIVHLFYSTLAGYLPFHGSLLAFIKDTPEHTICVQRLLPKVMIWLEKKAPEFLRWGWLWVIKAKIGHSEDLVNKPSREWVISSLANAYPVTQINEILSFAERIAFESCDFPRAIRLRWLKVRLENGIDYQSQNFDELFEYSLSLSKDDYPLLDLSANIRTSSIDELYILAKQYLKVGMLSNATECRELLRQQINDRIKIGEYDNRSFQKHSEKYLELTAAIGSFDAEELIRNLWRLRKHAPNNFKYFIQALSKHNDISLLTQFLPYPLPNGMRKDLELSIIRLAGLCQANIHEITDFDCFKKHPIVSCWAHIYAKDKVKNIPFQLNVPDLDNKFIDNENNITSEYLHGLFFYKLSCYLEAPDISKAVPLPTFTNREWLNIAVKSIAELSNIAGGIISKKSFPVFSFGYRIIRTIDIPLEHDDRKDYNAFRDAFLLISVDLFLLGAINRGNCEISNSEWKVAKDSKHFIFSQWLSMYIAWGHQLLPDIVIENELEEQIAYESSKPSQFDERAQNYLDLCGLAIFHKMGELASNLLFKYLNCLLGYGWHKDVTIWHVLDAIDSVSTIDRDFTVNAISKIIPIIDNISIITDGDDTNSSKFKLAEMLLKLMPHIYVSYYEHLLDQSEWYEADKVFEAFASLESFESDISKAIATSIWDTHAIGALREKAFSGDSNAAIIIEKNANELGVGVNNFGKEEEYQSDSFDDKYKLNISLYKPNQIDSLITKLKEESIITGAKKAIRDWFNYWSKQGKGSELLSSLGKKLKNDEIDWDLADILDDVFKLSLSIEGKRKAYKWIVAAQIHKRGWDSYYSKEDALDRFKVFSQHYASKWKQFILDTSKSSYRFVAESLVIPHHRLVHFLIIVDQSKMAKEVVNEMVDAVVEDVSEQPLNIPPWFSGDLE